MLGLLLPSSHQGCRRVVVVCEDAFLAKQGHSPSLASSPSSFLPPVSSPLHHTKQRVYSPPRICNLTEFGAHLRQHEEVQPGFASSLSAIIELSTQVQKWEVLSGRLAMMVFASALALEALTGNSVFEKMDSAQRVVEYGGATFVSIVITVGFAIALQAKAHVAYRVSKGYEKALNGFVDTVIDDLLFDKEDC